MEKYDMTPIDLNQADLKQLTSLPGIGQSMAKRIIAGRPYQAVDDLLQIKGLGRATLARIRPFLVLKSGEQAESGELAGEGDSGKAGQSSSERLSLNDRLDKIATNLMDRFQVSNQVLGLVIISGAVSMIFSVILSLAILIGINRTLNFGRHSSVREMRVELTQMGSQLADLTADLSSVDQRLQAVEGLSGRMATLESEFDQIQEDVDRAVKSVDKLSEDVERISEDVGGMQEQVIRFSAFLEGLRQIIIDLFEPVDVTPSAQ